MLLPPERVTALQLVINSQMLGVPASEAVGVLGAKDMPPIQVTRSTSSPVVGLLGIGGKRRRSFARSFHPAPLRRTEAYWLDEHPTRPARNFKRIAALGARAEETAARPKLRGMAGSQLRGALV
jgi:hypothetical protein